VTAKKPLQADGNSAYPAIHRSLSGILARSFSVQTGATGLNHVLPLAGARRMPGVRCLRDHGTRGNRPQLVPPSNLTRSSAQQSQPSKIDTDSERRLLGYFLNCISLRVLRETTCVLTGVNKFPSDAGTEIIDQIPTPAGSRYCRETRQGDGKGCSVNHGCQPTPSDEAHCCVPANGS
jgi:hypothetical protein